MAVLSRLSVPAVFLALISAGSGLFGDDRTIKRVDELLGAAEANCPRSRLVATVFSNMSESELAGMLVDSSSMSLRLRAAEELALYRGDRHPADTFVELLKGALDLPVPPQVEDAIRCGVLTPARPGVLNNSVATWMGRYESTANRVDQTQWSISFEEPESLVLKVGARRRSIEAPFRSPSVAAKESEDGIVICAVHDSGGDAPPLLIALSAGTGEEVWRRNGLTPAIHRLKGMTQRLELVIRGEQVYLFGACPVSIFIECFSVADGTLLGSYRSRASLAQPKLRFPAGE